LLPSSRKGQTWLLWDESVSRVFVADQGPKGVRVVEDDHGFNLAGGWIEVEDIRALEVDLCAVLEPPLGEKISDGARMTSGPEISAIASSQLVL
jgi:hypothetical protein